MQPSASDENTRDTLPRVSGIPQNLRLPNKIGQQLLEDAAYIDELYDAIVTRKALADITVRAFDKNCPFDTYAWRDPSLSSARIPRAQMHELSRRSKV